MGNWVRSLAHDGQLRWIGPEKGAIHMAVAAIVNAFWDLWAKMEMKPVWKLLVDMTPDQVVSLIDFRWGLTGGNSIKTFFLKRFIQVHGRLYHERRSHSDVEETRAFQKRARNSNCSHWVSSIYYFCWLAGLSR